MKKHLRFLLLLLFTAVTSIGWADSWVKTDPTALQTGDKVVIVDLTSGRAMTNTNGTSSAPSATAISISGDELAAAPAESLQWEVTVNGGNYKFGVSGTSNYLYCTSTNNGVRVGTNNNNTFTLSSPGGDNNVPFLVNSATSRYIGVYNSQDWRCYTTINNNIKGCVTAFFKYTTDSSKENANVTIGTTELSVGGNTTVTTDGPSFTLGSSNTNVATVSGNTVNGVGAGLATITATWDEDDNYNGGAKTFDITVKDTDKGTEATPYTVAEALALINNLGTATSWDIYVSGIVSQISEVSTSSGNATYYISDDGQTTTQLYVYRGKYINGANFTSADQLQVGDEVIVFGQVVNYQSKTPEFTQNNMITSFNRPGGKQSAGLAYNTTSVTKFVGDAAFTNELTNPYNLTDISYDSSEPTVATVDNNGEVTIMAVGSTIITASFAGNNDYDEGSASYTLTVKQSTEGELFHETFDNLTSGKGGRDGLFSGSIGSGSMTDANFDEHDWSWTTTGTGAAYLCTKLGTGSATGAVTTRSIALNGAGTLTFSAAGWGDAKTNTLTVTATGATLNGTTQLTLSNGEWNDYSINIMEATGNMTLTFTMQRGFIDDIVVTEGNTGKLSADLSYSANDATVTIGADDNIFPLLNNPNNLTVTYASSETSVATVDNNGTVTLVAGGTTVIMATSPEDDTYEAGSASYTLTVVDPNAPGTENNPYTVAEARAAIDANTGVTGVYAKGIVSEIVTPFNSQYGNISYNISEDGTTTADQLQAYRGKSYNGDNFTSENDIQVGDTVVVYGNLKKYNTTYEFDQNNQLVSLSRPQGDVAAPTFSPEGGEVVYGTQVTISMDDNAVMVIYTTDGSTPTYDATGTNGEIYDGPITITADVTIKAIAVDNNEKVSTVATATYTIIRPAAPIFSPAAGTVDPGTEVTISMDDNAIMILYTTDGSTPSFIENVGEEYTGPITVNQTMTIKAIAIDDNGVESEVATATYTVEGGSTGTVKYKKITSLNDITSGEYLIVYEDGNVAFDGSLETLDAVGNVINVDIANDEIIGNETINASTFTIDITGGTGNEVRTGTLKSASGYFIGQTSDANGLKSSTSTAYENRFDYNSGSGISEIISGGAYLRFNSASNQNRFRYFKSSTYTSQKAIHLYKKVVESTDVTVTVSNLGYATMYYSDRNLVVPENVTATTYEVNNGTLTDTKTYEAGNVIPAGTGVVLQAAEGSYTFTVTEENGTVPSSNMLCGFDQTTTDSEAGYKYYILSTPADGSTTEVGFYYQAGTSGASVSSEGHKAYLKVPTEVAQGAQGFALNGHTTGITTIDNGQKTIDNGAWYTIDGRQLNGKPTQKGVYVNNGRKIIVK